MSCSGRLTAWTASPVRASNVQGIPKPTASTSPPTARRTPSTACDDHLDELQLVEAERRAVGTVMDRSVRVHGAGQQLGAAEIDADHASLGHAGHLTARTSPWPTNDDRPYTTYKARPRFLQGRDDDGLDPRDGDAPRVRGPRPPAALRPARLAAPRRAAPARGRRLTRRPRRCASSPSPRSPGCWSRRSLFLVSAQIQESKISDAAERQLSSGGFTLTSPNTVLVLGSDARTKGTQGGRRERRSARPRARTRSC